MLGNMKELSVFVLLMLTCMGESKPLQRVRRTIVKDYFNPLTYPTDKLLFEKGEDGEYHEQKPADLTNSKVEYAVMQGIEASNEIFGEALKSSEKTLKSENTVAANTETPGFSPASSGASKFELQKESVDLSTKVLATDEVKPEVKEKVLIPETTAKLDFETKSQDAASKGHDSSAKLDIPIDSKWSLVPKPDSKDDKPYEGGEEYLPEPPIAPEEKEGDGKVEIGQIPKHHPVFVPPNIPWLVPKRISFRVLSLLPKSPAIDVSDRLPLPEPDVFEESSETAVVENISPSGPMLIKEGRRYVANHLINPFRIGLQLPFLPSANVDKEAVDEEKLKGVAKFEIVDIGGRKMLLQRKVLMSPRNDPSHMEISVMSIQPLEDVDPEILKELDVEKKELESEDAQLEKDLKLDEKKEDEKRSLKEDEVDSVVKKEAEKRTVIFPKLLPQPEIVGGKEPEVMEEKAIDAKIPPPEVFAHAVPAIEMAAEGNEKEEKKDLVTRAFEVEAKIKDEDVVKAKETQSAKESGIKTEIQAESKFGGDVEKDKGMEILTFLPEEKKEEEKTTLMVKKEKDLPIFPEEKKEEEKTTAVVEEEKDLLLGTEDLFKFRNQIKIQNPTRAEIGVDLTEKEFGFDKGSQTKDEEVAESESVEVKQKPEEESKYNLDEAITEGKKGDGGMLIVKEVAQSHSGTEFTGSKDIKGKTGIPEVEAKDLEKVAVEGKKDDEGRLSTEGAVASHSATEVTMSKDAKDKTDIMKTEPKELHGESQIKGKKGDDEMLNTKEAAESHVATEIIASKEAKEKIDIISLQHSEESSPETEDFGLTKTEGAILEERKKKFDERKDKVLSKKKKCKCEDSDSDESDSEDEDEDDLD